MVEQYSAVGSEPVAIDSKRLQDMGIRTVRATLISQEKPAIHDPERLGKGPYGYHICYEIRYGTTVF